MSKTLKGNHKWVVTRRDFLTLSSTIGAGLYLAPKATGAQEGDE